MLKKVRLSVFFVIASALALILNPGSAFAITNTEVGNLNLPIITTNKTGTQLLTGVAATVINLILLIAGILAVIYLVVSGVTYVTAGGDTGKAEKGRTGVVNAVIGLVIIAAAYIIVRFVSGAILAGGEQTESPGTTF